MALDEKENRYGHLVELGGSDFEIADGEPNIKGWDVENQQGKKIGEVDELLFDPQSLKVRYLVVDLDDNELGVEDDKKVLIPIGIAELHGDNRSVGDSDDSTTIYDGDRASDISDDTVRLDDRDDNAISSNYDSDDDDDEDDDDDDDDEKVVIVPVTSEQLIALPPYEKGGLSASNEQSVRSVFEGGAALGTGAAAVSLYDKDDFYNHEHFNEDKFYNSRQNRNNKKLPVIKENLQVDKTEEMTGGARIRSRIVERPVEANLNLKEEHVTVQRNPVDRPVSSTDSNVFKEEEMEIKEYAEVPVVTKEARVVEEVSVNKEVEEKERTVKETLRNTEVDTERIGSRDRK